MSVEKELEEQIESIAKEINNITYEEIENFLENAIDIQILTDFNKKQITGLSILLTFGGPNIEFVIKRGKAELIGSWGSVEYRKCININKANDFIDYLSEIYY
jgi:hypothetical protein